MNRSLLKILASREDISDYLFHFTCGKKGYTTLAEIINSFSVKDMNGKGYICFTETPITMMTRMFDFFNRFSEPMYAPYGIAIPKIKLYELGGRPAIYGTKEDKLLIDPKLHWRFIEYSPYKYDFSWLREWRINTNEVELDKECYVITKDTDELAQFAFDIEDVKDVEIDGCVDDGHFVGYGVFICGRRLKGISFEQIRDIENMTKEEINKLLAQQKFDDTESMYGGGLVL